MFLLRPPPPSSSTSPLALFSSSSSLSLSSVSILAQGPAKGGISSGPINYLLVHFCTKRSLSFMSQSWWCTGCGTWNWGESPFVSLLRADSERIQWKFVGAGCEEMQDKWKREWYAHQATGQATVQWCLAGSSPDTYISGEKL